MSATVGAPDVAAFGDVLDAFATEAETAPMHRLVEVDGALTAIGGKLDLTRSLVTTAMLRLVENRSITLGGVRYWRKPKRRKVTDHAAVRAEVIRRAVYTDDGEKIGDPELVADRTYRIVFDLFLSDSSAPKVGAAKMLSRSYDELVGLEEVGSELGREQVRAVPE